MGPSSARSAAAQTPDFSYLSDAELLEEYERTERLIAETRRRQLLRIAVMDRAEVWRETGHRSMAALLKEHHDILLSEARAWVKEARRVAKFEDVG